MIKQAFLSFEEEEKFSLNEINNKLNLSLNNYEIMTTSHPRDYHIVKWAKENNKDCIIINIESFETTLDKNVMLDCLSVVLIDSSFATNLLFLKSIKDAKLVEDEKLKVMLLNRDFKFNTNHVLELLKSMRWLQLELGFSSVERALDNTLVSILDFNKISSNIVTLTEIDRCHISYLSGIEELNLLRYEHPAVI